MALYQVKNLNFAYPGEACNALENINLEIYRGDFSLLCGPTGSGKTTLLRLFKKEVQPEGVKSGTIRFNGMDLEEAAEQKSVEEIAMVFQDPDDQIVMETVWQELCFAMENLGYKTKTIQRRLAEVANYFGIESLLHKPVHELSGGQKQLLNLASVMMLRPKVLLLDEPTAQLDPIASKDFLDTVYRINQELSVTVIISEHRLEEVYPLATKVLMLEGGMVKHFGNPKMVIKKVWNQYDSSIFLEYLPSLSRLYLFLNGKEASDKSIPLTVKDAKKWIENDDININSYQQKKNKDDAKKTQNNHEFLSCKEIYFQYNKNEHPVLRRLSLKVKQGEFYALLGGNGSGKTTLLKAIAGIIKPQRGKIVLKGKNINKMSQNEKNYSIGYLAQNPSLYFNRDSVETQLKYRAKMLGLSSNHEQLEKIINLFEIKDILKRHPYDISGGQQQKVALALVLMSEPNLVLLDEPTKGLDPLWKLQFAGLLNTILEQGSTIFMVSHDLEFTARFASKCALLFDGQVIGEDLPRIFFGENYYYTTVIQRALGEKFPHVIGLEDVSI